MAIHPPSWPQYELNAIPEVRGHLSRAPKFYEKLKMEIRLGRVAHVCRRSTQAAITWNDMESYAHHAASRSSYDFTLQEIDELLSLAVRQFRLWRLRFGYAPS